MIFGGGALESGKDEPVVRALALLQGFLGDNKFLTGDDVTLADISVLASLTVTEVGSHKVKIGRYTLN